MDRNLPNRISEFSCARALNMGSSFASFACFAVELHYSGSAAKVGREKSGRISERRGV
jgi:hypothetical protein